MEVVYKLWEGSWADDAVAARRARAACSRDPDRVCKVQHEGPHYRLDAQHLSEPSPQRTPVLYQAGTSPRGRLRRRARRMRVHVGAVEEGDRAARRRDPRACRRRLGAGEILMFAMMTVILGRPTPRRKAKYADYRRTSIPRAR
jgi:alkanesulfonate monooxygenase SsuD/methylene tetrahydromethanopterin reductase-like flavin-dependent oxidoreductase (luciferase family)